MKRRQMTTLREERAALWAAMNDMLDSAQREVRDLTADEAKRFDRMERELRSKGVELEKLEAGDGDSPDGGSRRVDLGSGRRSGGSREVVTLGREQRMSEWAAKRSHRSDFTVADASEFCIGNVMRALVEPSFRSELTEVEKRALSEGTDSAGGFTVPDVLSVNFIDKVRNRGRVFQAGATTVPLDSDTQSIPRLSGDPTFSWRNESAAFADSDATFERVTFTPRSGGFIVKTSEELYQDMVPGAGGIIENALVQTAALELDRVALRGSGTAPEPRGIRNQSGVTVTTVGGANGGTPTKYTDVMSAITSLLGDNIEPTGWMMSPRTSQFYAGLVDTTDQPLTPPQPVAELDRFVTAQIPNNLTTGTSTDTSEVYVGRWADLLVGIRLGIQLRLLTERYSDNGQFAWRVFLRADVQLAHPESFEVLAGVRP